jgi:hypothetical protein
MAGEDLRQLDDGELESLVAGPSAFIFICHPQGPTHRYQHAPATSDACIVPWYRFQDGVSLSAYRCDPDSIDTNVQ